MSTNQQPVHQVSCAGCYNTPIVGYLYQCTSKTPTPYLCGSCFSTKLPQLSLYGEAFTVFYNPGQVVQMHAKQLITKFDGSMCKGCAMRPIIGTLYKCTTSQEKGIEFCHSCFISKKDSMGFQKDGFHVFTQPGGQPSGKIASSFTHYTTCGNCAIFPIHGLMWVTDSNYVLCSACFGKRDKLGITKTFKEVGRPVPSVGVHKGVRCVRCGVKPIKGRRFKNVEQKNVDLCETCFNFRNSDEDELLKKKKMGEQTKHQDWSVLSESDSEEGKVLEKNLAVGVHKDVTCVKCSARPIVGLRHKCTTKRNVNLCALCFPLRGDLSLGLGAEDWVILNVPSDSKRAVKDLPQVFEKPPKHRFVSCSGCKMKPIVGRRFECKTKEKYNLCLNCFNSRNMMGMVGHDWVVYVRPKVVENEIKESQSSFMQTLAVHKGETCKSCRDSPIRGRLYKNTVTKRISLCQKCFTVRNQLDSNRKLNFAEQNWNVYDQPEKLAAVVKEYVETHSGIKCDMCKAKPVRGTRYKCTTKRNYDLCPNCFPRRDVVGMYWNQEWEVYEMRNVKLSMIPKPTMIQQQSGPMIQQSFPMYQQKK